MRQERMRQMREGGYADAGFAREDDEMMDVKDLIDLNDPKGSISEWLRKPETIKFVSRQFN